MDFNDGLVQEHYRVAYNFALYKLGNSSQAEDVAAQTINLFLLKSDMINIDKTESWVRTTCLNYCRKLYDKKLKERHLYKGVKENLIESFGIENNSELTESFKKSLQTLDELETRSLVLYFNCGQNTGKMAKITGENHSCLRKRIYRIKKKIKAETYRNLGYIATKKIVPPKMHEAIIQFVRRLKKSIENNTIDKMFYYFSETNVKQYKSDLDIQKVKEYEILLDDGKYKVYVFYLDSNNQINSFRFSFYLNDKNQLKVTDLPKKQNKIFKFNKDSEASNQLNEMLKNYPENRQGLIKIPKEIMKRLTDSA